MNASLEKDHGITIFLCGDVMTGRGIDQIMSFSCEPVLYEPYVKDARDYVRLAERANGPIPRSVLPSYIWGDALDELEVVRPDLRIVNLETSVTQNGSPWPDKEIHYRMHPKNVSALIAAKIDICSLANNHILDWGYTGLLETISTLKGTNIKTAGAGRNKTEAQMAATKSVSGKGSVIFFSFGSDSSGIPRDWAATDNRPGINLLPDLSDRRILDIGEKSAALKRQGDIVILSIHWGGNWGYSIPDRQIIFAHKLIDEAGVDVIHGHSSHHVRGIEVYRGKLILYGCGDFLNDYEGISGYEEFRNDLGVMYFAEIDPKSGRLAHLRMSPTWVKNFRVNRASSAEAAWIGDVLAREGKKFGTSVELEPNNTLDLKWHDQP